MWRTSAWGGRKSRYEPHLEKEEPKRDESRFELRLEQKEALERDYNKFKEGSVNKQQQDDKAKIRSVQTTNEEVKKKETVQIVKYESTGAAPEIISDETTLAKHRDSMEIARVTELKPENDTMNEELIVRIEELESQQVTLEEEAKVQLADLMKREKEERERITFAEDLARETKSLQEEAELKLADMEKEKQVTAQETNARVAELELKLVEIEKEKQVTAEETNARVAELELKLADMEIEKQAAEKETNARVAELEAEKADIEKLFEETVLNLKNIKIQDEEAKCIEPESRKQVIDKESAAIIEELQQENKKIAREAEVKINNLETELSKKKGEEIADKPPQPKNENETTTKPAEGKINKLEREKAVAAKEAERILREKNVEVQQLRTELGSSRAQLNGVEARITLAINEVYPYAYGQPYNRLKNIILTHDDTTGKDNSRYKNYRSGGKTCKSIKRREGREFSGYRQVKYEGDKQSKGTYFRPTSDGKKRQRATG